MELPKEHPKRVFIERTIELDVRLSYYDRIKGTIPQKMLEAGAMMLEAPGSDYAYDAAGASRSPRRPMLTRRRQGASTPPLQSLSCVYCARGAPSRTSRTSSSGSRRVSRQTMD